MRKPPSVQLPALFVRLPVATHDLLRELAAAADESVSRYVVALIESQRPGGPQLPPQRPRKVVAPPPVEVASEEPVRRKRGRPRKVPLAPQPPVEVAVEVAPVAPVEQPPRRPRGRPRKVPAEVVATPPHKRAPRVELAPVEEPVAAAPVESRGDTLDRIRAALARLEEPHDEELPVVAGESRVVLEESP
jgi:hypothetical protein